VRILVVEPIASEGIERLRADHEVDERPGISREELCAILPGYDALVVLVGAPLSTAGGLLALAIMKGNSHSDLPDTWHPGTTYAPPPTSSFLWRRRWKRQRSRVRAGRATAARISPAPTDRCAAMEAVAGSREMGDSAM